jgi:hypothetical protein
MALFISTAFLKSSLRSVNQGSTYLGLAMIGLIWLGLYFHLQTELTTAQEHEIRDAKAFPARFESVGFPKGYG